MMKHTSIKKSLIEKLSKLDVYLTPKRTESTVLFIKHDNRNISVNFFENKIMVRYSTEENNISGDIIIDYDDPNLESKILKTVNDVIANTNLVLYDINDVPASAVYRGIL